MSKEPLKADLVKHQAAVRETLERVINDGEHVTITDQGKPVAVMLPYTDFRKLEDRATQLDVIEEAEAS